MMDGGYGVGGDVLPTWLELEPPRARSLQVYALDPNVGSYVNNRITIQVPWEPLLPGPAGAKIAVVDYDAGNDCSNPANPCRTIQHAHDVALARQRIIVAKNSNHVENVTLTKGIQLFGDSDPSFGKPTLQGSLTVAAGVTDSIRFATFSVVASGASSTATGVILNSVTTTVDLVDIDIGAIRLPSVAIAVPPFASRGLFATMAGGILRISHGVIAGAFSDGLFIQGPASSIELLDLTVMLNGGDGIQLAQVAGSATVRSVLSDNNGESGVQVEGMLGGTFLLSASCIQRNQSQAGVTMSSLIGGTVTITGNTISLNPGGGASLDVPSPPIKSTVQPNAIGNFWGSSSGPSGAEPGTGDSVSVGIDVKPFSATPPATVSTCR